MQISWLNPQQFQTLTAKTDTASATASGGAGIGEISPEEAEQMRAASERAWVKDMNQRSEEGVTLSSADKPEEVSLTAVRYLEKAAEMRLALSRLKNTEAEPDLMQDLQKVLEGEEPEPDSMAGYVAQRIALGGADGFTFTLKFHAADLETGSDHDAVSLHKERVLQVYTGDGADAVSLRGNRIHSVHTDRDNWVTSTIAGNGTYKSTGESKTYANADSLSITGSDVGFIETGGGNDAIAIRSDLLQAVDAGEGDDAVSLAGRYVRGIRGGAGNDEMVIRASLVSGVDGGQGDDRIAVMADRAAYRPFPYQAADPSVSSAPRSAAQRLADAARHSVNVDGGSGDDQIHLKVASEIAVSGGAGNDSFLVDGGTVALKGPMEGHDTVDLANGAEVVLAVNPSQSYAVEQDGNSLKVVFDNGASVTFRGLDQAGAIGIGGREITMLHPGPGLDLTV